MKVWPWNFKQIFILWVLSWKLFTFHVHSSTECWATHLDWWDLHKCKDPLIVWWRYKVLVRVPDVFYNFAHRWFFKFSSEGSVLDPFINVNIIVSKGQDINVVYAVDVQQCTKSVIIVNMLNTQCSQCKYSTFWSLPLFHCINSHCQIIVINGPVNTMCVFFLFSVHKVIHIRL